MQIGGLIDRDALDRLVDDTNPGGLPVLVETFLSYAYARVDLMTAALDENDFPALAREAHALSPSAATFGAHRLHVLLEELEDLCRLEDSIAVAVIVRELGEIMEETDARLQRYAVSVESPGTA